MKIPPDQTPTDPPAPMASTTGELRQLRQNSSATVAELRQFLKQLQGRSPQEMLGIVAGSQLVRAIGLSTVLVAGAAVLFTAIPFALGGGRERTAEVSEDAEAPTEVDAPSFDQLVATMPTKE